MNRVSQSGSCLMLPVVAAIVLALVHSCAGDVTVTETPVEVETIQISGASGTLLVGESLQLHAERRSVTGKSLSARPVVWRSENAAVAEVSSTGLVTARQAGTATIVAESGGKRATVTVTVEARPAIGLMPMSLSFTASRGTALPSAQPVAVSNTGGGTLSGLTVGITYKTGGTGWLTVSLNGTTAPAAVTVRPGTTAMAGTFTADVCVSSGVAGNSPQCVAVTYVVTQPMIGLSPTTLSLTALQGAALPEAQTIAVNNTGGGTLSGLAVNITYKTGGSGWLTATISPTTAPAAVTIRPNTTATTGTFTADVCVSSTAAINSPQCAAVTYAVSRLGEGFGDEQFASIPAGTFQMGDMTGAGSGRERPVHQVTITKRFLMQKTEVTQGQWREVMGTNPSHYQTCGDLCPVEQLSWDDIQLFLAKLNEIDPGKNYRLPTEAEWEYAARAGTTGDYGGTGLLNEMGWYWDNSAVNGVRQPHPVARKQPNHWGLYDMHGNAWEWVQDWYSGLYYQYKVDNGIVNDPLGPTNGTARVARGGSFDNVADFARSAFRLDLLPSVRGINIGFRLVRTL
jgi:formylglycine-generating enzyme required for sulfatase activity